MGTAASREPWATRALRTALACLLAAATGGCSFGPDTSGDPSVGTESLGDGRIFIDWTVGGAAPNLIGCGPVDHLSLTLAYRGTSITITPIPCAIDRFRYDKLATGDAQATLTGFDVDDVKNRCPLTAGTVAIAVTPTLPDSPSPTVALPSPHTCR